MLRFGEIKVAKEELWGAKKPIRIWDVDPDKIVISKLVKTNKNSNYFIGYLDKVIRPLVLISPKMSGYVKTFKDISEDKNKTNKLMNLCIDDHKLLEKCKTMWTKIENLKSIELDALLIYDDRYIKKKKKKKERTVIHIVHTIVK